METKRNGKGQIEIGVTVILLFCLVIVIVTLVVPLSRSFDAQMAITKLANSGYVVADSDEYLAIITKLDSIAEKADLAVDAAETAVDVAEAAVTAAELAAAKVDLFNSAEVSLFPYNTGDYVLLGPTTTANEWGNWTILKDNHNVTLASKFAEEAGYIADLYLYAYSADPASQQWLVEIAYGESKVGVTRIMFNTAFMDLAQIKSRLIPAGESVYYRIMCDAGPDEYISVGFRYFYED